MKIIDIITALATNDEEYKNLYEMLNSRLDETPSIISDNLATIKPNGIVIWGNLIKSKKDAVNIVKEKSPILVVSEKQIDNFPCYISDSINNAWLRICHKKLQTYNNLKRVAVTGSVGKTTVKDMIYSVMKEAGPSIRNHASINGWRGVALAVMGASPDVKYYVAEMGLNLPNNAFVPLSKAIEPDVCVLTNIGDAHFENFKSKEHILEHKYKCAYAMSEENGTLVVNYDDPIIMGGSYRHRLVTVSIKNENADYYARDIMMSESEGLSFNAVCKGKLLPISMDIVGEHNVFNALLAVAVGQLIGIDDLSIQKGLGNYQTDGMRQNILDAKSKMGTQQKLFIDCYNASSDSMKSALDVLRDMKKAEGAKKIAILGDMVSAGKLTEEAHTEIGRIAIQNEIDVVIGFGESTKYTTDYVKNNSDLTCYQFSDANECADYLQSIISENDILLVKGSRKMKMEDIISKLYNLSLKH